MVPLAVTAALALAAPPPKPVANPGRITVWLGDKCEHFKPDGKELTTLTVPAQLAYGFRLTPDLRAYVAVDYAQRQVVNPAGGSAGRIVVTPLGNPDKAVTIEGYLAQGFTGTIHGTRAYFTGWKGDEITEDMAKSPGRFVLDVETKKVATITLPEKHTLFAVSPDGQTFLTTRIDQDATSYSRRTFRVTPDGKATEILKANVFPTMLTFSPDGSKVLALTTEYTDVKPVAGGGIQMGGAKPREYKVLDPVTNTSTPLRYTPGQSDWVSGWDWSPNGSQIALLVYDRNSRSFETVPAPGGGQMQQTIYDYRVLVGDADGANAKEVYKTKGASVKTFMWK
jgi:WD40 repeat protein